MEDSRVSLTALLTAYARTYHAAHATPKLFNDYLADQLFTEEERAYFGESLAEALKFLDPERAAACPDRATALAWYMRLQGGPITLSRSRYTEDSLIGAVGQGVRQYVILGAGMETFAFRQPELMQRLRVFEIDHPATQAFKRQRLAELGWDLPERLHFVPLDFTRESLAEALRRSPYDPQVPSFFSWLGVTYYLTREVVFDILRAIANVAPAGSLIIFDYMAPDAFVPERAAKRMQRMQAIVRQAGEPMKAGFDPSRLAADLETLGLRLQEDLSPADIEERYFRGRSDGYHAYEHVHFAQVAVGGA
jgi:methyltransferase (TIGR00027 family)